MNQKRQKELFERHCKRIELKVGQLKGISKKYSWARAIVFLMIVVFGYFTVGVLNDYIYTLGLIAGVGGFLLLVDRHYKVHQSIEKFGYFREIKEEHIARLDLNWKQIPSRKFEGEIKDHAYAKDLDIVGPYSLHHLLDTSIYEGSTHVLLDWLMKETPDKQEISKRQQLVKELIPLQGFRDKLAVIGKYTVIHYSEKDWTMDDILRWLKNPVKKGFKMPLAILSVLSAFNISLALLAWMGFVNAVFPVITLVLYLSIYKLNSDKISGLFEAAYQMDKLLGRFRELLLHVEEFRITKKQYLEDFLAVFHSADSKPSAYLKKVEKLTGAASLQTNQVVWPLVNLVIPWDMYYSMKLESLKEKLEPRLTKWLDTFYELEALNSLANFGALHREYTFPELTNDSGILFEAKELGHPLIPANQKVSNNFKVEEGKDLFLITGSNMAGKSTFLRTVGINLCLAFAGAPVNAALLKTNLFRVFTSINVKDSLEGGLSHFYAEVRRLRTLLNKLGNEEELPLFYFVDEIFKGTNNRERFQGSTAFLKEIAGKHGVGMVSTHDLELASLETQIPELSNWHFAETIENGRMSFEYKIKEGPCPTTNALKIMKMEGLPVE